jgi:hypothetical protein
MSDPENFLSRWSRRKLDVEQSKDEPSGADANEAQPGAAEPAPADAKPDQPKQEEPAFDITTLPSLESIGAETDIRVFLQKGVPADLTRAALRRAWTADPAIRDFIEMAENQWDFATGKDLPGFGPLQATDDVRKMVAEIFGEGLKPPAEAEAKPVPSTAETPADTGQSEAAPQATQPPSRKEIATAAKDQPLPESTATEPAEAVVQRNEVNVAMQQNNQDSEYKPLAARRPHGRALPE